MGTYTAESESQENGGKQMALILFVEYHATFRQAASYLMDQESDLEVVAQGGSVAEAREKLAEGGMVRALPRAGRTVRGLPRWAALAEAQPASGRTAVVHRRSRGAPPQGTRAERLLARSGFCLSSPEREEGRFLQLRLDEVPRSSPIRHSLRRFSDSAAILCLFGARRLSQQISFSFAEPQKGSSHRQPAHPPNE